MDKLVQENPLLSPISSPNANTSGVANLLSTPLSPPLHTSQQSHSYPTNQNNTSPRLSETNEVIVYPSSVSLRVCINKTVLFLLLLAFVRSFLTY